MKTDVIINREALYALRELRGDIELLCKDSPVALCLISMRTKPEEVSKP